MDYENDGDLDFITVNERLEEKGITVFLNDGIGTVSYTHLRAHETVLDLVCRLLLEKKKFHIQHGQQQL